MDSGSDGKPPANGARSVRLLRDRKPIQFRLYTSASSNSTASSLPSRPAEDKLQAIGDHSSNDINRSPRGAPATKQTLIWTSEIAHVHLQCMPAPQAERLAPHPVQVGAGGASVIVLSAPGCFATDSLRRGMRCRISLCGAPGPWATRMTRGMESPEHMIHYGPPKAGRYLLAAGRHIA